MDRNYFITITFGCEKGQYLGFEERCSIKRRGYFLSKIGEIINCSVSNVLNELHRGTGTRNGNYGQFIK